MDVTFVDVPAGVTQEEDNTGFPHLPSVLALIFLARRYQPFLSLIDREVKFRGLTIFSAYLLGILFVCVCVRKNPSSCDDTEIRTHVPTTDGFEVTN